jgi:N-acetylgalactosamine kinase
MISLPALPVPCHAASRPCGAYHGGRDIGTYEEAVERFLSVYGPGGPVYVARAPGRVNLVGMHIDHQGGAVNPIGIRETRVIARPRPDRVVRLANADGRFPDARFALPDILPPGPVNWGEWTLQVSDERRVRGSAVEWSDYVKAALIALQEQERDRKGAYLRRLRGMDIYVESDLPAASGLSSSSALVVASAFAAMACSDIQHSRELLVRLLGESEWYVGLRGGIGDHAVILLAKAAHLCSIELLPTHVEYAPFPDDCRVVVCHSGVTAEKSAGAKNTYNERVAGYGIGLTWLRRMFPAQMGRVDRFRDLHPAHMGVSLSGVYEMLAALPIRATRRELEAALPDDAGRLAELYATHDPYPDGYRLRGVCLYGAAECERSRRALTNLRNGDVESFGHLMDLSHDGDRVVDAGGLPYSPDLGNAAMAKLAQAAAGSDPGALNAALHQQTGAYAASCPELDALVDCARGVDGVLGAGLVGAGLGGCVSVLVRAARVDELVDVVERGYYAGRDVEPFIEVCAPVDGASVAAV